MYRVPLSILLFIAPVIQVIAQSVYFNNVYGQPNTAQSLFGILPVSTGYVLSGVSTKSPISEGAETYFLLIDKSGDTILTNVYSDSLYWYLDGSLTNLGKSIIYLNHGGPLQTSETDIQIWWLNNNLDTLRKKTISYGNKTEAAIDIQPVSDHEFIVAGVDYNDSQQYGNAFAIKLDTSGNIIWQQHYGLPNWFERFNSVTQTPNGDLFFCGMHGFENSNNRNIYLVKTDSLGNFLWEKSYGGGQYDYGGDIIQTTDGHLLITGFYGENGSSKGYVLKVDTAGNQIWAKGYNSPGLDALYVSHELADGSLVFSGNWNSDNQEDGWLMKTDANGKVIWSYAYDFQGKGDNQANFEYFWDMQPTADGGFVMCGTADNFNGNQDAWVVKVDSNGLCDTTDCYPWIVGIDEPDAPADPDYLQAWPNPAHDLLQVRTTLPEHYRLQLLSTLGQAVLSRSLYQRQWLDVSALPAGVYLLELRDMKGKLLETDQILITDN